MSRPTQPTITDQHGYEAHPAFGMIGASRVQTSPPGAVLFDSDIRHQHTVVVRIQTAARKRSLHRDWHGAQRRLVEVEMSEAQWASFVSSMNVGDGVPCTVRGREGSGGYSETPGVPYEPRLRETMDEVRNAAVEAQQKVLAAYEAYEAHKTKDNLRTLKATIDNLPSNLRFAASSLSEHAENVVQRARADIEAMVLTKAQQLGIEPGDLGVALLPEGDT